MAAPDSIQQLVKRFEEHRVSYLSGKYNEAQLRQEFLNPFFEALGWDVFNKQGYAEAYKEVIHEASLEVEGAAKAPDYAFRVGGTRKFFVEAKKPAVNIQYDIFPAFQLRRYAWSAKLPLGVLTDFEEFAVYESRSKPDQSDSAATGRVMFLNYKDYLARWDEIAAIFSREAVLKGSFDQYAGGLKGKKGTTEVDDAFLEEMEHWRDLLARMLALRNPDLQVPELNYAVQMTIDRIVFLRICEDRGIERENQLQELLEGDDVYERLCQMFRQADSRYNSGLFHFAEEKGQSSHPDDLTLRLAIDDKVLKEIIGDLYYPSPYVFREIPADILGQVYERFLGKVIRLTAGHQAKVEEKPEVRKAGGVYYTPTYIVNYIVKNTVGKLLEGHPTPSPSPDEIHVGRGEMTPKEAAGIKILDPACGSGSFLLGAYQYLLDWHTKWYSEHEPEKWAKGKNPPIYQAQGGGWRLTTSEKKRILLSNIHGVDIDPQAVEVTKLSLSLKVLEGESQESIGAQLGLFKERALPDLGRNIQCGNSLISPDYYEGQMFPDEEERMRVNAFNWQVAFPQVFTAGGFDAVIGNPPYFNLQTIEEKGLLRYYQNAYESHRGKADILFFFVEKAKSLLKPRGLLGYIVAHYFLKSHYADKFRDMIMSEYSIQKIIDFGSINIFTDARVDTCVILLEKQEARGNNKFVYGSLFQEKDLLNYLTDSMEANPKTKPTYAFNVWEQDDLSNEPWQFQNNSKTDTIPLSDICFIGKGAATGNDNIFIVTKEAAKQLHLERELLDEIIDDSSLSRYWFEVSGSFLIRSVRGVDLINYPNIKKYLLQNKCELQNRFAVKNEGLNWYEIVRFNKDLFSSEVKGQIYVYYRSVHNKFAYSDSRYVSLTTTFVLTHRGKPSVSLKYLVGILNSKFMENYSHKNAKRMGGCYEYSSNFLQSIPIKIGKQELQNRMILLVDQIIALYKNLAGARTPQEQERLRREIESTDGQIDRLVYELYGLTEGEIKIVESK